MNETRIDALRGALLASLLRIAPEIEGDALDWDQPLRDQVDLDSMDWLNFLVGLHRDLKVEIPEADYAKLVTMNDLATYIESRRAG